MRRIPTPTLTPTLLAGLLLATTPLHAADNGNSFYKWTDEQGNVHYSDHMPADEILRKHEVFSASGQRVRVIEQAPDPAERKRQEALEEKRAAREAERREREAVLMRTYASERDIIAARDSHLAAVDRLIRVIEKQIANSEERLAELREHARQREADGRPVPGHIREEIEQLEADIRRDREFIEAKQAEKADIRSRYHEDLEAFREIMERREREAD